MKKTLSILMILLLIMSSIALADNGIKKISFTEKTLPLAVGTAVDLRSMLVPEGAAELELEWKSGKDSIASVDSDGVVTGIKKRKNCNHSPKRENESICHCKRR